MTELDELWRLTRDIIGTGRLSVVMPVYNLSATIEGNLVATAELFDSHSIRAELVPVDDGSADGTADAIRRAAARQYSHVVVKPVFCERNGGKGAALKAGFAASTGEYVMLLDGDLDIHPKQTPWFFEQVAKNGADIVVGSKRHRRSVVQYPWHRRVVSWVYFTLVRMFIGLPLTDTQTGMKLFRRQVLGDALARMLVKTYAFDLELLAIAHERGAKIAEAPVVIRFGNKFGALSPTTVKTMALDSLAVFYRLRLLRYYSKVEIPPPLARDPMVSIVIACPGDSWMLRECLAAIAAQTYRNFEVIVLPDGELAEHSSAIKTGQPAPAGQPPAPDSQPSAVSDISAHSRFDGQPAPDSQVTIAGQVAPSRFDGRIAPGQNNQAPAVSDISAPSRFDGRTVFGQTTTTIIPTGKVRPAEKRNIGINAAKGDLVAFIDDDAYPDAHWLEYAVKYFGDESIGAVGGPGVTPPGDGFLARAGGRVYDSLLVSGNYRYRYKAGGVRRDVDDYPSCNLIVRTGILKAIGGYRTDFWPGEDTLLCKDIIDSGKRIVYDPWVVVFHHRRALFGPHLRQLGRYAFHRGYFVKRYPSNSLHLSYFVPSAFVAYLLLWLPVSCISVHGAFAECAQMLFLAVPLSLYAALVVATSFAANPLMWAMTAAGIVASHVCYGVRFVQGLFARRAPCEFIGKDHA